MRSGYVFALALWVSACATPAPDMAASPGQAVDPQQEAVLAAVDAFLLALGNRDGEALARIVLADSQAYLQRGGGSRVTSLPNATLAAPPSGSDPFIERYWSPTVSVRGDLAQVWTPYELRDNGQRVHCGVNAFQLVRMDGQWRIAHLLSSMEPDACDELIDEAASDLRPRDGWRETPLQ